MNSKNQMIMAVLLGCVLVLGGCGSSSTHAPTPPSPYGVFADLDFGSDETFEIVTWNIQNFPKEGIKTTNYVAQAIAAMDPDIIALQEIESSGDFVRVIQKLDESGHWSGYRASSASYDMNLALIYKDSTLTITAGPYEIFGNDWWALPRSPLVLECTFGSTPLVIIDNHFKASGGETNEARRRAGSELLEGWIDANFPDTAVILLGDLNDQLTDASATNVFQCFLDRPNDFRFADMAVAIGNQINWSYPSWPSHIDHIMITNELFVAFADPAAEIRTLVLGDYLSTYSDDISDHRPVGLVLPLD